MRTFLQALYRITLRGIGAIGILLLTIFALDVSGHPDAHNFLHPVPIVLLTFFALSSIVFASFQRRLPDAIVRPHRAGHLAVLVPILLICTWLSPVAAMMTFTGNGPAHAELMRPVAVSTGLVFIGLYLAAGLLGLILSLTPLRTPPPPPLPVA